MHVSRIVSVFAVAAVVAAAPAIAQTEPTPNRATSQSISVQEVDAVVKSTATILRESYVFPEVGERMAQDLVQRLEKGEYRSITDHRELADRLTSDARAISNDKHLGVMAMRRNPDAPQMQGPNPTAMRRQNYGFEKVERLDGNIGYLKFDVFMRDDEAKELAAAAMAFLAHCDALIIDLRENGGGSPDMIRFITSYFFEKPTLLNTMVDRTGNVVEEYHTLETVPGKRFAPNVPIYVLTSSYTFSGAEEFAYNLKNLKRATIIGETTGGGAHPVRGERIDDTFVVRVPFMRAQNPITKTNWEGVGVEPDIQASATAALERAIEEAKAAVAARDTRR